MPNKQLPSWRRDYRQFPPEPGDAMRVVQHQANYFVRTGKDSCNTYSRLERDVDWRTAHTHDKWNQAAETLKHLTGFDVPIFGMTPDLIPMDENGIRHTQPGDRGREILAWLAENPEVTDWVAIDDIPGWLGPDVMHRSVITHPRYGITDKDVDRVLQFFAEN